MKGRVPDACFHDNSGIWLPWERAWEGLTRETPPRQRKKPALRAGFPREPLRSVTRLRKLAPARPMPGGDGSAGADRCERE